MSALSLADYGGAPVPDYAEPVEAWRVWRIGIRSGGVVLRSLFADVAWEPCLPLAAMCAGGRRSLIRPWRVTPNDHASPELACTCGIYGAWFANDIFAFYWENSKLDGRGFGFRKDPGGFLGTYILTVILNMCTFGIYFPWGICNILKWEAERVS